MDRIFEIKQKSAKNEESTKINNLEKKSPELKSDFKSEACENLEKYFKEI